MPVALFLAMPLAAFGRTLSVSALPSPAFADTEVTTNLAIDEVEQLKRKIAGAERVAINSKAEWQAAIKVYRAKWDASLVFIHE